MPTINSRDDLLNWLSDRTVYRSVKRHIALGHVEVLGGFTVIPPYLLPGWFVIVTFIGEGDRATIISIQSDGTIQEHSSVPWKYWCGEGRENLAYRGDDPSKYLELKKKSDEHN